MILPSMLCRKASNYQSKYKRQRIVLINISFLLFLIGTKDFKVLILSQEDNLYNETPTIGIFTVTFSKTSSKKVSRT